ncbi:hypothetical protein CLF_108459 [Clonorchis sinensis]|uniref:C2H2-type domain-containing protein n=1 Tax=Clonorchis sinensis TaxID=79923 RepID=G7YI35_CLOSI|nr:hypothetical protein CLF_108459 [Clonorchis sinensis]
MRSASFTVGSRRVLQISFFPEREELWSVADRVFLKFREKLKLSVPTNTQERLLGRTCEEFGNCSKSKAGLVAHDRVHDNQNVGTNMVAQLACADCSRLFPTKVGQSQYRRHAHTTQHNAGKLDLVKYSGARWSQQESLLHLANNLCPSCGTQTALSTRLEQYFPGLSTISIKTWQAQQDESSSGGSDQTIGLIAAYSSEADDYGVWPPGHFHTPGKTASRRRRQLAHRMPVNRRKIRRANYAAIQTLYHQRRKDAASAVLDGSWRDLYRDFPSHQHTSAKFNRSNIIIGVLVCLSSKFFLKCSLLGYLKHQIRPNGVKHREYSKLFHRQQSHLQAIKSDSLDIGIVDFNPDSQQQKCRSLAKTVIVFPIQEVLSSFARPLELMQLPSKRTYPPHRSVHLQA